MGEGKTRVIVPMLVLHWTLSAAGRFSAQQQQKALIRLNFLPELLPEVFDYLHETLTGGIFGTKLFEFPFHRDVEVTPESARALLNQAALCGSEGGAALVTPAARLSLLLKRQELLLAGGNTSSEAAGLLGRFSDLPWRDVLDESDAVLYVRSPALVHPCPTHMWWRSRAARD